MGDTEYPEENPVIVFVDDEPSILTALQRAILGRVDADVVCFSAAEQALNYMRANTVDVLVSDVRMPGMDGISLLAQVYDGWPLVERVLMTGYADLDATVGAINLGHVHYYLQKPWDNQQLVEVLQRSLNVSKLRKDNVRLEKAVKKQNQLLRLCNERLEERVQERTSQLLESYDATLRTFVSLVEGRLENYQRRSSDVVEYCEMIAARLALDAEQTQALHHAAVLRNIGKISFSDDMLQTPFEMMSAEQREEFCQHPLLAQATIAHLEPLAAAAEILLRHKERLDGKGYPHAVAAENIPVAAQVLCCVSDFFELIDGRMARHPLSPADALVKMQALQGAAYSPEIIGLLKECAKEIERDRPDLQHCLSAFGIQEGDVLARDIVTEKGLFVLAKGKKLDGKIIERLRYLEANIKEPLSIYILPGKRAAND